MSTARITATVSCPVLIDGGECRCNEELTVEVFATEGQRASRDCPGYRDSFELASEPEWCEKGQHAIDLMALETIRNRVSDGLFEWEAQ